MQNTLGIIAATILGLAFIVVLFVQTSTYLEFVQAKARYEAVDGCLQSSSYTYSSDGVTTVEPIEKAVRNCLELKLIQ